MKKPCSISCSPGISASAMRGTRPGGVPAISAPSGIHTMPRGAVGSFAGPAQGGPASDTVRAALGAGAPPSRQAKPAIASAFASNTQHRALLLLGPLALIPLSQAELLHLELQAFA